ncbi:hypothetical protein BZA05DRAFT_382217 [Tricharina praecox]|uniref:uncharacterized protein n=1 Tax=Tricharina praecox TaxID=43433 RepID=UPI00221F2CEA|nr:uncharacterized protein BZA05DRAFT_382217 [Tricharina praecox]KAI5858711.1 hypothetical protein BZA05DRAFT_382217 [Tricharina praecox]
MTTIPAVRLLMHAGTSQEYTMTVPTAPHIYTAPSPRAPSPAGVLVPYRAPTPVAAPTAPQSYNSMTTAMTYRPPANQPDHWSLRVPDAAGDGWHKWEYTHMHAPAECGCRECAKDREREREREERMEKERVWQREKERERSRERLVVVRRSTRYWR